MYLKKNYLKYFSIGIAAASVFFALGAGNIFGATAQELEVKINDKTNQIQELEKVIQQLNSQIAETGKQKKTLQNTLKELDITNKKVTAELNVTQNKIYKTDLDIERLGLDIDAKGRRISDSKKEVSAIFRKLAETDDVSLLETLLTYGNTSELWNEVESLNQIKNELSDHIQDLIELKADLSKTKDETEIKKQELVDLKKELGDRKKIVDENVKEKNNLLAATKNKESNYLKTLEEKKALQEAFQKELSNLESDLKQVVNQKTIPKAGIGILSWPLDKIKITQKFGHTAFAATTAAYNGGGHNGVDFGISTGTKVKAALSGVVTGAGNTDSACPGASYGKWVLIKHYNGLSTLYAHLSLIKVSVGDTLQTGDTIGYSGNTGYSTGPHLHFTVMATDGIAVKTYNFKSCAGASVTMPQATKQGAYLDPMQYL